MRGSIRVQESPTSRAATVFRALSAPRSSAVTVRGSRAVVVVAVVAAVVVAGGCSKPQFIGELTIEPVQMEQMAPGVEPPDNAYVRMDESRTEGRFSCGMSVVRVHDAPQPDSDAWQLMIAEIQQKDTAHWTKATRNLPAISFVTFFDWSSVPTRAVTIRELLSAAQGVNTRLLLVYAQNELGPNEAEVLGALYDTETGQLLGAGRTMAKFIEADGTQEWPSEMKGDQRWRDARYVSARRFESMVHDAIYALSLSDSPATQLRANPWGPMRTPDWPWLTPPVK